MLCQRCNKNTATTHIKTVINGKVTEQNLCGYCAAMTGYSKFVNNSFASMLTSMFGDELLSERLSETRCECCNSRFSDIAETGKMGCSECYKTFNDKILPYLKRVHGTTSHIGKHPTSKKYEIADIKPKNELDRLQEDLLEAIKKEEFEKAAELRDKIKAIKERQAE